MLVVMVTDSGVFFFGSDIQSLQDEVPELKNRLIKAEADLKKAVEGEKKASDEVSIPLSSLHCVHV